MRCQPFVKQTRREFIREKRREIRGVRKALNLLHLGCGINKAFDGTGDFMGAVCKIGAALDEMDRITKPLA